jgi:arylsulfatase A
VPAGQTTDAIFTTIDFMPTVAKLCGFPLPTDRIIDGIDPIRLWKGTSEQGRESFYFDHAGLRLGRWKYLQPQAAFRPYAREPGRAEVGERYDLDADIGERHNLASTNPDFVARLRAAMKTIEGQAKAKPE